MSKERSAGAEASADETSESKIVVDDSLEIDVNKRVGKLVTRGAGAGRLIEVNLNPAKPEDAEGGEEEE